MNLNPFKLFDPPRKHDAVPADYAGPGRDPFEAVPVHNALAECRKDSRGCYQIRMRIPPGPGFGARLAEKVGLHKDVRVDLDSHGTCFWAQIDGQRNLRDIEEKLRTQLRLPTEQSREATLRFTKMLMLRHLIQLDIGECAPGEDTGPTEG